MFKLILTSILIGVGLSQVLFAHGGEVLAASTSGAAAATTELRAEVVAPERHPLSSFVLATVSVPDLAPGTRLVGATLRCVQDFKVTEIELLKQPLPMMRPNQPVQLRLDAGSLDPNMVCKVVVASPVK